MLLAVLKSAGPLLWAMVILALVMFLFAVFFMQGVAEYVSSKEEADLLTEDLRSFFGTLLMTLLTLFMCVTGGLSWWDVGILLMDIGTHYILLMSLFILVMVLAVLNIITGIFVNDAIEMATKDRDIVQQMEKDRSDELFGHAHKLFATIDVTGSGEITAEEFETAMERDHVRGFLAQMGLEVPDALKMFDALDSDQNGCIQVDEFVLGCMRMRGGHNVDLETLMRENRRFMRETVHQQQRSESRIQALMKSVNDALALPLLHSRGVLVWATLHYVTHRPPKSSSLGHAV